ERVERLAAVERASRCGQFLGTRAAAGSIARRALAPSRPLDREHPGVQPAAIVICRSQAARSGEPAPPDAALLSRLSLQRSVPGVWLLRAGIQMSVPSWRQFPSLSGDNT